MLQTPDNANAETLVAGMLRTIPIHPDATAEEVAELGIGATYLVSSLEPSDPIQAMMACRMITLYYACAECLRRASLPDLPHTVAARYQSNAERLGRQMDATHLALRSLQAAAREQAAPAPEAQPRPAQPAAPANNHRQHPMPSGAPAPLPPGLPKLKDHPIMQAAMRGGLAAPIEPALTDGNASKPSDTKLNGAQTELHPGV